MAACRCLSSVIIASLAALPHILPTPLSDAQGCVFFFFFFFFYEWAAEADEREQPQPISAAAADDVHSDVRPPEICCPKRLCFKIKLDLTGLLLSIQSAIQSQNDRVDIRSHTITPPGEHLFDSLHHHHIDFLTQPDNVAVETARHIQYLSPPLRAHPRDTQQHDSDIPTAATSSSKRYE